eukprot:scaffold7794_cov62-Cyclotella_meneghiniana.AAC.2
MPLFRSMLIRLNMDSGIDMNMDSLETKITSDETSVSKFHCKAVRFRPFKVYTTFQGLHGFKRIPVRSRPLQNLSRFARFQNSSAEPSISNLSRFAQFQNSSAQPSITTLLTILRGFQATHSSSPCQPHDLTIDDYCCILSSGYWLLARYIFT